MNQSVTLTLGSSLLILLVLCFLVLQSISVQHHRRLPLRGARVRLVQCAPACGRLAAIEGHEAGGTTQENESIICVPSVQPATIVNICSAASLFLQFSPVLL